MRRAEGSSGFSSSSLSSVEDFQSATIEDTEPFNLFPCSQRSLLLPAVLGLGFPPPPVAGFALPSVVSFS